MTRVSYATVADLIWQLCPAKVGQIALVGGAPWLDFYKVILSAISRKRIIH